jgi:hypothetical protein
MMNPTNTIEDMKALGRIGHSSVTPAIGAALAAVGAAVLIGFALVAQVSSPEGSAALREGVGGSQSGSSPNAIVLPGLPEVETGTTEPSDTGTTAAPAPAPALAFLPEPDITSPSGDGALLLPDPTDGSGTFRTPGIAPRPSLGSDDADRPTPAKAKKGTKQKKRKVPARRKTRAISGTDNDRSNDRYRSGSVDKASKTVSSGGGKVRGHKAHNTTLGNAKDHAPKCHKAKRRCHRSRGHKH